MHVGLLLFPSPTGPAAMAQMAEQMGSASVVHADTRCRTPGGLEPAHARRSRGGAPAGVAARRELRALRAGREE
jgi:hypothetical protein